jgi:hypothetical protein
MGGASACDLGVRWRPPQRRYREILIEVRRLLDGSDRKLLQAFGIIRALRGASPEYFDRQAIRKTREDAREIIGALDHLEDLLRSATLGPELRLRLGLDTAGMIPEHAANAPAWRLMTALNEVRDLCQQGDINQPAADQVRIWCARIAYSLMDRFSTEEATSGSADSPYRVLASLLYEVLTGEAERDLKRACDQHLREMRMLQAN